MKLIDRLWPNRTWRPYSYRQARTIEILGNVVMILIIILLMALGAWLLNLIREP